MKITQERLFAIAKPSDALSIVIDAVEANNELEFKIVDELDYDDVDNCIGYIALQLAGIKHKGYFGNASYHVFWAISCASIGVFHNGEGRYNTIGNDLCESISWEIEKLFRVVEDGSVSNKGYYGSPEYLVMMREILTFLLSRGV